MIQMLIFLTLLKMSEGYISRSTEGKMNADRSASTRNKSKSNENKSSSSSERHKIMGAAAAIKFVKDNS